MLPSARRAFGSVPMVRHRHRHPRRHGTAIIAALGLVALAGALLSVAAAQGAAGAGAAAAERNALVVEGAAMRALAEALVDWSPVADSLPEGAFGDRALVVERRADEGGPPLTGRLRVQRIGPALYAVTVEVRAASGVAAPAFAHRRMRLLVRRATPPDTTGPRAPPTPLPQWAISDLY